MCYIAAVLTACCISPSRSLSLSLARSRHIPLLLIFSHTLSRLSPIAFLLVSIPADLPLHASSGLVWIFQESSVSLALLSGSCLATKWVGVYNPPPISFLLFHSFQIIPFISLSGKRRPGDSILCRCLFFFLRVNKAFIGMTGTLLWTAVCVMFLKSKCAKYNLIKWKIRFRSPPMWFRLT